MRKTIKNILETTIFLILICLACLLTVKSEFSSAVTDGISLWFACVLPSLFPYMIITALLSSLKVTGKIFGLFSPITTRLFRVNGSVAYAFFTGIISGYPVGSSTVADLKEKGLLSDAEAVRAVALCSTSSPVFTITSVGAITFKSVKFGVCLFACHLIAVLLTGFIFSFYKRKEPPTSTKFMPTPEKVDNLLYESVFSAVLSLLAVGGLITVFYLLTEILLSTGILTPVIALLEKVFGDGVIANALTLGLFECTKGLKALSGNGITFFSLPIATAICSFGGLSVIMQSLSFIKRAKIKTAPFILSKIISASLGFGLGCLVTFFIW